MARRSSSGFKKRQKEIARQEKRRDKISRRQQRSQERKDPSGSGSDGVDPDIAGIVPGPQPPQDLDY
ncbi:MAG TPA: hypothetical protein VMQ62_11965 [Dongiaceae bacterium]|jgi:hypothetical protein|nr:hypothetical protein [Dongiaceae bacterium]